MSRTLAFLAAVLFTMPASAQQVQLPDTPEGKLVAGFLAASNDPDEQAITRFQEAFFSADLLKRRPAEERAARNRMMRDQVGRFGVLEVRRTTSSQVVVLASGSSLPPTVRLLLTFTFAGNPRKIDAVQIVQQP